MRQRHAAIIDSPPGEGESVPELVQSTDQAWHMGWLLPSALIITAPTPRDALLLTGISLLALGGLDQLSRLGRHEALTRTPIPG